MWSLKLNPATSVNLRRLGESSLRLCTKAEGSVPAAEPAKPEPISVNTYIHGQKVTSAVVERKHFSFDAIPGPASLRLINKFWSTIPLVGSEVTVSVVQYLLSGGKFFSGLLTWGGNANFFRKFFRVYGPVVRLHGAFGSDVVLMTKPEHAAIVFRNEGQYPIRSCLESLQKYRIDCRKYQQPGLFSMYGSDWEKIRKAIEEPLVDTATRHHRMIDGVCEDFVQRIMVLRNAQEEVPNSFLNEIYKWSLECLWCVTLNKRLGFLDMEGLSPASDPALILNGLLGATQALRKCEYGLHLWKFIETPAWKSLVKHCDMLETILSKYVQVALDSLPHSKDKTKDASFLESLVTKSNVKYPDVMTILLDMFIIGGNATAHTVAFLLYHLAKNPRCQIRLHEEIIANPQPTLTKMSYLQACIKECLRMNPPIPILSRVLTKDIVVYNYKVPKGTHVLFASHLNSFNEEYFEDAGKYRPERWLNDELGGFGNEYQAFAAMPFGYGPRSCVAKHTAQNNIALLLYKLCRNFKVEYNYGDIPSSNRMLASPTKPLRFRFVSKS